jgi:hypothetical protein
LCQDRAGERAVTHNRGDATSLEINRMILKSWLVENVYAHGTSQEIATRLKTALAVIGAPSR